jgi:hypothetical protein
MEKSLKNRVVIVLLLCSSLLLIMPLSAIAQESENGNEGGYDQAYLDNIAEIEANKAAFAQELAARWEAEALARGNDETWLERISGSLSEKDAGSLLSMSEAESYDEFIGLQTTSELVFYPLTPCRIVDTRFATKWGPFGTPVPSGGTINVRTYPSLAGQGGAANCGVNSDSAAVVINVTAVPVRGGQGFLTVYPFLQPQPNASLVNYNSGSTSGAIANAVSQSQCRLCAEELRVFASRTTHVIIDVIGYFARPTTTKPETLRFSNSQTIGALATVGFQSPNCPSGYARTGGNCNPGSSYNLRMGDSYVSPNDNPGFMRCTFRNTSLVSTTAYANVICARQPGR